LEAQAARGFTPKAALPLMGHFLTVGFWITPERSRRSTPPNGGDARLGAASGAGFPFAILTLPSNCFLGLSGCAVSSSETRGRGRRQRVQFGDNGDCATAMGFYDPSGFSDREARASHGGHGR